MMDQMVNTDKQEDFLQALKRHFDHVDKEKSGRLQTVWKHIFENLTLFFDVQIVEWYFKEVFSEKYDVRISRFDREESSLQIELQFDRQRQVTVTCRFKQSDSINIRDRLIELIENTKLIFTSPTTDGLKSLDTKRLKRFTEHKGAFENVRTPEFAITLALWIIGGKKTKTGQSSSVSKARFVKLVELAKLPMLPSSVDIDEAINRAELRKYLRVHLDRKGSPQLYMRKEGIGLAQTLVPP